MPEEPIIDLQSDHHFMGEALRQAAKAYEAEEVPIGAVVVREGRIIARAFNQVELLKDATAHAEMLAVTQAESVVGDWRLTDCTLYVTKEPCPMCAGAIVHVRLARVVFRSEAEEVPIGAVVVREGRIIARAFNQVELLKDATAHAEMLAVTQAESVVGDWRLTDCTLYVTKEPCPMCAGAIVHVRLARVVF